MLARLGRLQEAAASFTRAAELTSNTVEQLFLRDRAINRRDAVGAFSFPGRSFAW